MKKEMKNRRNRFFKRKRSRLLNRCTKKLRFHCWEETSRFYQVAAPVMACRPPRHARSPTAPALTLLAARSSPAATMLARTAAARAIKQPPCQNHEATAPKGVGLLGHPATEDHGGRHGVEVVLLQAEHLICSTHCNRRVPICDGRRLIVRCSFICIMYVRAAMGHV